VETKKEGKVEFEKDSQNQTKVGRDSRSHQFFDCLLATWRGPVEVSLDGNEKQTKSAGKRKYWMRKSVEKKKIIWD
jgi:hypothetical protein